MNVSLDWPVEGVVTATIKILVDNITVCEGDQK